MNNIYGLIGLLFKNTDPSEYLSQLMDEYLEWRIKVNPEYGTNIGVHDRDDRITEMTEEAFVKHKV